MSPPATPPPPPPPTDNERQIERLMRLVAATGWWEASDNIPDITGYRRARATELFSAMKRRGWVIAARDELLNP
jgi:hypothetical protein